MYFYLKTNKNDGLVILRYTIKGNGRFVYSTGIKINPKDWDAKNKNVKANRRGVTLASIRKELSRYSEHLETIVSIYKLEGKQLTRELLKNDFDKKFKADKVIEKSVIDSLEDLINEKISTNQAKSTIKNYNGIRNKLIEYERFIKHKLTYSDFENGFLANWLNFSYEILDNNDNTTYRNLGYIKTFLKWGAERNLHNITDYSQFKAKFIETDDIALSASEVFEILNFDFKNKSQQRVIDMFLIGCFTGQRYSDYSVFDKTDYSGGKIIKRAKKTKLKVMIPVDDNVYLKRLLDKYDWCLPIISNQKFNTILKKALSKIESLSVEIKKNSYQGSIVKTIVLKKWEMCGSHTARRTFITVCLEKGWTYKEVMAVAGITKVETLMKYDKISFERLSNKVKETWKEI